MLERNKINVLLLVGGSSPEAEISRQSGKNIEKCLIRLGYNYTVHELNENIIETLQKTKPDVVFIGLHGCPGEDGTVQGLLDILNIPYTHSGVRTSSICIDKILSKMLAKSLDIPTPTWKKIENSEQLCTQIMDFPYIIKPVCGGSSQNIEVIENQYDVKTKQENFTKINCGTLMTEKFIKGREITVCVAFDKIIGTGEMIIDNNEKFYSIQAKYHKDTKTKQIFPCDIDNKTLRKIEYYAETFCNNLGYKELARIDFRINENEIMFLELNTHPGFTDRSMIPKAVKDIMGLDVAKVVDYLIIKALKNHENT